MEGFLLIDKPEGLTSHDVVNRVRRLTGEKRVGHAGTLDPFATGLLIVGVGRVATREMEKLVGLDKVYEAEFRLGASSDTDDRTGILTETPLLLKEDKEGSSIENLLHSFVGTIQQLPPAYSAIKIGGKKMYEAAREGKPLEAKLRTVTIYSITVDNVRGRPQGVPLQFHQIFLSIHCSTGTYIRAIARDLGAMLGTGGYVQELRRTKIGPFAIEGAHTLESLSQQGVESTLISVKDLLAQL